MIYIIITITIITIIIIIINEASITYSTYPPTHTHTPQSQLSNTSDLTQ